MIEGCSNNHRIANRAFLCNAHPPSNDFITWTWKNSIESILGAVSNHLVSRNTSDQPHLSNTTVRLLCKSKNHSFSKDSVKKIFQRLSCETIEFEQIPSKENKTWNTHKKVRSYYIVYCFGKTIFFIFQWIWRELIISFETKQWKFPKSI